jgi:hypothetical protein
MPDSNFAVADLVAGSGSPRQSVKERINRRLEVLREWMRNGIPSGRELPKSLTEVRLWEDPEMGIFKISSPNEFTTTHPVYGKLIGDIGSLLSILHANARSKPSKQPSPGRTNVAERFDRKDFEGQLGAAVSQWQSQRDQRIQETKRANAAEARCNLLVDEIKERDALISELRRQIASREGLRAVE